MRFGAPRVAPPRAGSEEAVWYNGRRRACSARGNGPLRSSGRPRPTPVAASFIEWYPFAGPSSGASALTWIERVAANILPLSKKQRNVVEALREWLYTGDCYDLGAPIEVCQLCDHPNIRYQFVILNQHTGEALLIGSECITRFSISAVDDEGNILSDEATKARVKQDRSRLITDAKRRRMMNTLVRLASVDADFDIQSFIDYFDKRNAFTPNQLSLLFWRLGQAKMAYSKADFKMVIRRNREKEKLLAMPDWKVKKLRPAMSSSQQEWYIINKG